MKIRTLVEIILVSPILFFIISCQIPIETIEWEPDGEGFRQLYTNDPDYSGYLFYNWILDSYESSMTSVEAYVKTVSGSKNNQIGVVFNLKDSDNFDAVLVDTSGNYDCRYMDEGRYNQYDVPHHSSHWKTGKNVTNCIRVTYNKSWPYGCELYFNDIYIGYIFRNVVMEGYCGYIAWIFPTPSKPVDVRFRLTQPIIDP